jgi:beta-N-acetylhexosaminidase
MERSPSDTKTYRLPLAGLLFIIPVLVSLALLIRLALPLAQALTSGAPDVPVPATPSAAAQSPFPATPAGEPSALSLGPQSPRIKGAPSDGAFWIDAPDGQLADYLVEQMGPNEQLGQMFLLGWPRETAVGPIMDWIGLRNLGGVKIFGWNGAKLSTLATALGDMQAASLSSPLGIPLFTATDQEGGMVRHVKDTTSITPGNMALGAGGLAWDAYESARLIAAELKAIGINLNFAPTVDTYINADAHVIGPRAFGSDPVLSGHLGIASLDGMRDERVIATAKHFPGHGNASGDSHGMMPVLQENLDTLWNRDFIPYRMMIPEGLPAILIGHLAFPNISGDGLPASLSPKLNRRLLREKLRFEGVVITDDLYMGGASAYGSQRGWGMSDIVVAAIEAGNDVIMMSRTPESGDAIWDKCLARYHSDQSFRDTVRQAVRRILLVKLAYLKPTDRVPLKPDPSAVYQAVPAAGAEAFFRHQAARSVTVVYGSGIPLKPAEGERVALVGQDPDFIRAGLERWPRAEVLRFGAEPFFSAASATLSQAKSLAARVDRVIICLENPNSQQVLMALRPWADRVAVVSTLTPVYLEGLSWVRAAVAVYGQSADSFRYGIRALLGEYAAPGKLPVSTR